MLFPLRLKLALLTSALLIAGIGTVSVIVLAKSRDVLIEVAHKRGMVLARDLAQDARQQMLAGDREALRELLAETAGRSEVLAARILDRQGRVLGSTNPDSPDRLERLTLEERSTTRSFGGRLLVAERILFPDFDVDLGEAQVVIDLEGMIADPIGSARREILLASGVLLGLGLLIGLAVSGRVTRPLRRLRIAVNALAAGDLSAHVEPTTRDEIGDLTRAFNELSERMSQKRKLESAFRRYVSDHVLREVLDRPDEVGLEGEMREVTVLFIDIRGFSRLTDEIGPERLVAFLNDAFTLITGRLLDHGVTVDKYIGDAILGYVGAPIATPDHAARGLAAAIAVQRSVEDRNATLDPTREPALRLDIGIGIHVGRVVVGNIGSSLKMDYTAVGEPVNVANRLQKLARRGEVLVSGALAGRVEGLVALEPLGPRKLEGRDELIEVFRVEV